MSRKFAGVALLITFSILMSACAGLAVDPIENGQAGSTQAMSEQEAPSAPKAEGGQPDDSAEEPEGSAMKLMSGAFQSGEPIPAQYSCDGEDSSPPLQWRDVPAGVASFALIMDDPDAPVGTWDHWLLYNLPADSEGLAAAVPSQDQLADGSLHGRNSWGNLEYGGPCPPSGTHRYFFRLYALDEPLDLEAGASKAELNAAMEGHVIAQTELMGTYSR